MRLSISRLLKTAAAFAIMGVAITTSPVMAELDGSMRDQMEFLDFSEHMIREGLYPKTGHDVFDRDKKGFVRGIRPHNAPMIYEPDVYTWELAMAEHNKKLALAKPMAVAIPVSPMVTPSPMTPPHLLPAAPAPVQLTPIGPQAVMENQEMLPPNANERMARMAYRARARGLYPGRDLRAEKIKQKLVDHMNSLGQNSGYIPALMPALPKGKAGDSYDSEF